MLVTSCLSTPPLAYSTVRARPRLRFGAREQIDTPLDSPRSGSDSDAAYDSLRGVLGKVHLGKYFWEFRRREIRLEELKHLTESDLIEASTARRLYGWSRVVIRVNNSYRYFLV